MGGTVGVALGAAVGVALGAAVGVALGAAVGMALAATVGVALGGALGVWVGMGATVGVIAFSRARHPANTLAVAASLIRSRLEILFRLSRSADFFGIDFFPFLINGVEKTFGGPGQSVLQFLKERLGGGARPVLG